MTMIRLYRDGRACRRQALCLLLMLSIAGCTAAETASMWPGRHGNNSPVPGEPWPPAAADRRELTNNTGPLRAGSTVLHPPSGDEAQLAVTPRVPIAVAATDGQSSSAAPPTPEIMAATLSEMQQLDRLTPAEQQRLLDVLKMTGPAAWPETVRNYGATLAKNTAKPAAADGTARLATHIEPLKLPGSPDTPAAAASIEPPSAEPPSADRPSEVTSVAPAATSAALISLEKATAELREQLPLSLKNLVFCTEVTSFGVYKPLEKHEFAPGQEVLLYAEIDNFISESRADGFHTALDSGYEITNAQGKNVAKQHFGLTEDTCRNARRDFFIRFQFFLPREIGPGTYTLQLTIQDTLGHKSGQASIELVIK